MTEATATGTSSVRNPFGRTEEARRYHLFRPRYHHIPFAELRERLGFRPHRALDMACGTGHSTAELAKICDEVIGCDASPTMLAEARRHLPDLRFEVCPAESTPFPAGHFDLVNVSMAVHWLDQERFTLECARLLRPGGHLSIDNYGFSGVMTGNQEFQAFHSEFYRTNFPAPERHPDYPPARLMSRHGFSFVREIPYEHQVTLGLDPFVGFLLTQSNVQLHANGDPALLGNALRRNYGRFFAGGDVECEFLFQGMTRLYRWDRATAFE